MYKRVTKNLILEGAKICYNKGYWSDETREFLEKFDYTAYKKINSILQSAYNSCQPTSSSHYNEFKKLGLI